VITAQSRQNIEMAFHKAIRANVVRNAGDVCDIVPGEIGTIDKVSAENLLLITLSTFVFRLVVIFRIAETPASLSYYTPAGGAQTLVQGFAEVANMCTGSLNRALATNFPHLAMSTPCTVSGRAIAFLSDLKPQYVASYRITINDSVQLRASLCICGSSPVEVDDCAAATEAEQGVGELEMF
jgi:hypothetical protein